MNLNKWYLNSSEKKLLLATALLLVVASSIVATSATAPVRPDAEILGDAIRSGVKVVLQVDTFGPDGAPKDTRLIEDDLITENFVQIMSGIMSPTAPSIANMKNIAGTVKLMRVRSSTITSTENNLLCDHSYPAGLKIAVGTGATSPASTDYKLQTAVTYEWITDPVYSGGNITFSAALAFSTNNTITEAGFFYICYSEPSTGFLLCRDTFDGVAVLAEDSALVTYTIMLGDNFTDNFGNLLAGIFETKAAAEVKTISLTDSTGASITVSVSGGLAQDNFVFDSDVGTPYCGIAIGNNSGALDRSDYSLGSQVGSLVGTGTLVVNSSAVICSSLFTLATADTITEAGYFLNVKDTVGNTKKVMLWRDTFDGAEVSAGQSIAITFTFKVN